MVETNEHMGIDPIDAQQTVWGPSIDGEEIRLLQARYQDRVSEEEWDRIVQTAASILGRCPNPNESSGRVTGLALGKVQSGKTLSYTSLIALGIDNGYRITIVLAGTKNALLEQSYLRLCNDLETHRPNVTPFRNPNSQDSEVISSVIHGEGHALIVVLKHRMRLDITRRIISSPELRSLPTLIIDDEGDEASLNTQFRHGNRSAIYRSILLIRRALNVHAYVAYTATPQANLLISGIDGLSPDFGELIEPGKGYCGGVTFFGAERDNYVRVVPTEESDEENLSGIPDGLKLSIATFLVGGAIRHLRESNVWHSMLIHNSNLVANHRRLYSGVRGLIGLWRERLGLPESDPAAQELTSLMQTAYNDLCTTVTSPPLWEEVYQQLRDEVCLVEVWMVNSLPLGRDPIGTPFRLKNNILVGGNMLGRGVTIEGLAVTYITRRAKRDTSADTMEQRARWFGYKQAYLDVCRIFVTPQLRDDYTELLRHEDDFWEALGRNRRQGLSIREWPRMLSLDADMNLRPTRSAVANYRQFRGRGWDIQTQLVENEPVATNNLQVVRGFFQEHPGISRHFGNVKHIIVEDCPTEEVVSNLLGRIQNEGTDWDVSYSIEYLTRLLLSGALSYLDVVFMSEGTPRQRTKNDGRVNPMQGRSPNRTPSDPAYYPGDDSIHHDQVQLQVHVIRVREAGGDHSVETTALALYIPVDDARFDLRYVVRDGT